jgi:hypothetical protein
MFNPKSSRAIRPQLFRVVAAAWLAVSCHATDDKKPDPPIPVKVEVVYQLPFFCVAEGLAENGPLVALPTHSDVPYASCIPPSKKAPAKAGAKKAAPTPAKAAKEPRYIVVPSGNADDVATQLQPQLSPAGSGSATVTAAAAVTGTAIATATGVAAVAPTQFALTATADKRSDIIFCRSLACAAKGLTTLEQSIDKLARPKFAYFKDYPFPDEKTAKALAKAVPVINAKLRVELVEQTTLRVESSEPLRAAEIADFEARLTKDQTAYNSAPGAQPDKDSKNDLNGPAPDTQVLAIELPFFCQSNDLQTEPLATDQDTCKPPLRRVQAANFDTVVQAVNSALSKSSSKLTVSKDGSHILIACDAKCSGDALQIAETAIATAARPTPLFVRDIPVPRGTAKIAAAMLNIAPMSATAVTETSVRIGSDTPIPDNDLANALERVRQAGFGPSGTQPLQRMFYRSAADVVGSLLTTPAPATAPVLGGDAATAPVTGNTPAAGAVSTAASTTSTTPAGTTISITNNPAPAPATPAATPTPGPAPAGAVGQGMTSVDDSVVFTDTADPAATRQRIRMLTLLDLPRPEVLMNLWSFQASSPDGKEMSKSLQKVRDLVAANNDALQHAIDYGWAYLSRQMKNPTFFDKDFHNYLTRRFVADTEECEANPNSGACLITAQQRIDWGLCDSGQYCLGYDAAFQPLRPTLTNILLGMMAAKDTSTVVLKTIGCMEGKFEVYGGSCFPDRDALTSAVPAGLSSDEAKACLRTERARFLSSKEVRAGAVVGDAVRPMTEEQKRTVISCDALDRAGVAAQRACGLPVTLPLSCFTIQAAKSFLPDNSFSTFSPQQLNSLAEENLAGMVAVLPGEADKYSATSVGLLRSSVADFLFNYKIAQEFPNELGTYSLPHSAQELNAQFNPLVVAFNQDVAALSRTLLDEIQNGSNLPNQNHFFQLWRHNKSYIADGLMTVRGISGVESLVDTDTQSAFDGTQAQTLGAVLSSITGAGSAAPAAAGANTNTNTITINPDGSASSSGAANGSPAPSPLIGVGNLFKGATSAGAIATALSAITPVATHSMIGRQLTLDVIPHTLPGASSAELDVRLWAQEDSAPTLYPESGASSTDFQSRVARHNVATRVRVESVKLFDVSTFTAMVQRPRAKLPIVPPFIEIPLLGSILSVPLPAAKVYHSSSAIVSALIVPTAMDLAYGLQFGADRAVFPESKPFSHLPFSLRTLTSPRQFPETDPIYAFHKVMVKCLAAKDKEGACSDIKFSRLPPER